MLDVGTPAGEMGGHGDPPLHRTAGVFNTPLQSGGVEPRPYRGKVRWMQGLSG